MSSRDSTPPLSSPPSSDNIDSFASQDEQNDPSEGEQNGFDSPMPAKRPKLATSPSPRATPLSHVSPHDSPIPGIDPDLAISDMSSDSEGDIPDTIPSFHGRMEDDEPVHDQVRECLWEDCDAGDLGNMDRLVAHIHDRHIEGRGRRYTCEWENCSRKSMAHASAYALKAHMRSHTREKPFYCALPECDRSFTRSDALAKHMRTVHETEALRPSDPVPKSMQPAGGSAKPHHRLSLKLVNKSSEKGGSSAPPSPFGGMFKHETVFFHSMPPKEPFSSFPPEEQALGPKELYRLLRRQLLWAEQERKSITHELDEMTDVYKREWLEKEVLLDQVIKNEIDWAERRKVAIESLEQGFPLPGGLAEAREALNADGAGAGDQEAAAVLASLAQG